MTTYRVKPLSSKSANLSVGPIPTDNFGFVAAKQKELMLTDRIEFLVNSYKSEISQLTTSQSCSDAYTTKVPRELLNALIDLVAVDLGYCSDAVPTFLQVTRSYLSSTNATSVSVQRLWWKLLDVIIAEFNVYEKNMNVKSAVARIIAMPISSDVQSIASTGLLMSALETTTENLDSKFQNDYPSYVRPQLDVITALDDVSKYNPQTIGLDGVYPATNVIDTLSGMSAETVEVISTANENSMLNNAKEGLIDLFSSKTLNVPLEQMKELGGNPSSIEYNNFIVMNVMTSANDNKPSNFDEVVMSKRKFVVRESEDASILDWSKSILEQDWTVSQTTGTKADFQFTSKELEIHNAMTLGDTINNQIDRLTKQGVIFIGLKTKRTYTPAQVRSLGSALKAVWYKLRDIKMPSITHIKAGTNLLAAGLGAIGQVTGNAGWVKASQVMSVLDEGLGTLIPTMPANTKKLTTSIDLAHAGLLRYAQSIIPNLVLAGYEVMTDEMVSNVKLRQRIAEQKRTIMNVYSTQDLSVTSFQSLN